MAKANPDRDEARREQKRVADSLKDSGALDEIESPWVHRRL
jgi:hypothetical protein